MNDERITDLARRAGLIAPYGSDHRGLRDFDYMMFAELLIKECANVIDGDIYYQLDKGVGSNVFGLNQARELIKSHFGVK